MADGEGAATGGGRPHSKSAWAAKSLRSGFGDQTLSHRSSAPAAGFGSSSRDAYGRQYASAEVDRAQARARGNADNLLGACYNVPVRVGGRWLGGCRRGRALVKHQPALAASLPTNRTQSASRSRPTSPAPPRCTLAPASGPA